MEKSTPNNQDSINHLIKKALALSDQNDQHQSLEIMQKITELEPNIARHWSNKGVVLKRLGEYKQSLECYQQALKISPKDDNTLSNIGSLLLATQHIPEAMKYLRKALDINSKNASAMNNFGSCLLKLGDYTNAQRYYEQALAITPNNAETQFNLSWCILRLGEFQRGFQLYESRFYKTQQKIELSFIHTPKWQGQPLQEHEKLCISFEQGFGDTIQFIRLVDTLISHSGLHKKQIILLVQETCLPLLQNSFRNYLVVSGKEPKNSKYHIPLLSLPHLLQLDPFNIPNRVPYIKAEEHSSQYWKKKLHTNQLKVGFIYQGSRTNMNDINRSILWKEFVNCFAGLSLEIHSLQIDSIVQQELERWDKHKDKSLSNIRLVDYTKTIKNFNDTASIIANLDLVIGVDSAVIHLSSAMAKPTFALISNIHDWRWFRGINHSPWYPHLKLLRKPKDKGWGVCTQQMNQILKQIITNHSDTATQ